MKQNLHEIKKLQKRAGIITESEYLEAVSGDDLSELGPRLGKFESQGEINETPETTYRVINGRCYRVLADEPSEYSDEDEVDMSKCRPGSSSSNFNRSSGHSSKYSDGHKKLVVPDTVHKALEAYDSMYRIRHITQPEHGKYRLKIMPTGDDYNPIDIDLSKDQFDTVSAVDINSKDPKIASQAIESAKEILKSKLGWLKQRKPQHMMRGGYRSTYRR